MDAQEWKMLISAYADGEVTPEESAAAERLLAQQPECRAYLNELRKLSSSLNVLKDESLSPDADMKILSKTTKERSMKTYSWKVPATVTVTLLVAVLAYTNTTHYMQRGMQARIRNAGDFLRTQEMVLARGGVQGRMKSATDDIGEQYSPGMLHYQYQSVQRTAVAKEIASPMKLASTSGYKKDASELYRGRAEGKTVQVAQLAGTSAPVQYEPYYQSSSYDQAQAVPAMKSAGADRTAYYAAGAQVAEKGMAMTRVYAEHSLSETTYDGRSNEPMRQAYMAPVDELRYAPYPQPQPQYYPYVPANTEEYAKFEDNNFLQVAYEPLSTFSADVDTASYSNIRRFLSQRHLPPPEAVRVEEMVNYFSYDYPQPWFGQPFSVTTDLAVCPWNRSHQLLRVGLKGKTPAAFALPASNLVFLIDVSGSMADANKLPLLKEGFKMMVRQLRPEDYVSIVVYAGNARKVLDPTSGANKDWIISVIDSLSALGSTAGGEGIQMAYDLARQNFISGGNNRVVLATDGDFNIGISDTSELVRMIEQRRQGGVFLTILGFGQDNLKDGRMSQLADKGNGNYFYIDDLQEAQKVMVNELGSTLFAIAKDVKFQVEFNPAAVKAYRLVGYEKRALAKEDFNNDRKDAGEIGAGHTVTALYEIVPAGFWSTFESLDNVDRLKYQRPAPKVITLAAQNEVLTVKLRYKDPDSDVSKLITKTVRKTDVRSEPTGDFAWASAVAEFGMLLSNSGYQANSSYDHVLRTAQMNIGKDMYGQRSEFLNLVETARSLSPQRYWGGNPEPVYYDRQYNGQDKGNINFKQ